MDSQKLRRRRFSSLLWGTLLVAVTLIAYAPALRAGFIWDDDAHVTENPTLRSLDGLRRIWFDLDALPQYYPLVHTTFWAEYHLWGLSPLGYHLDNVLLHAFNAVLLWLLLKRLSVPGAWFAAAVFALHPVHVESVAWITERKNVLSGFFYLAAIHAFVRFYGLHEDQDPQTGESSGRTPKRRRTEREHPKAVPTAPYPPIARFGRRRWAIHAVGFLLFVAALMSKTVSSSLPVALLIAIWWKRGRLEWREAAGIAPLFVVGAFLGLLTISIEKHHVGASGAEWGLSMAERFLVAGRALWFYAAKLVAPYPLIFIYPRWTIEGSSPAVWLFPAAVAAVIVVLWLARGRWGRAPLAAVLFFVAALVPALGFFDVFPMRYSFVADHFQYLASTGLIALLACLGTRAVGLVDASFARRWVVIVAIVLLSLLGTATWLRAGIYRDSETLWIDTIAKNPSAWMAHNNLGLILSRRGETERAMEEYREALRLNPDYVEAHCNLGNALLRKGSNEEAAAQYEEAVRLRPDYFIAQYNLGTVLLRLGRSGEAIAALSEAARIDPGNASAHEKLSYALHEQGRLAEAAIHYAESQRLKAWVLATHEDPAVRNGADAVRLAESACRLTGYAQSDSLDTLAAAYAEAGRFSDAERTAQQALNVARSKGQTALAAAIQRRMRSYEAGRPVRDNSIGRATLAARPRTGE